MQTGDFQVPKISTASAGRHINRLRYAPLAFLLAWSMSLLLSGCGVTIPVSANASQNSESQATLSSLSCSQSAVIGSGTDACTVTLSEAAGSGGFVVSLSSNNTAVLVPSSVAVPAGASTTSFTAKILLSVGSSQAATLTAVAGDVTKTYAITLAEDSASGVLSSVSCSQNAMSGPGTDDCTVSLTGAAGSGGLSVSLSSDNIAVSVPSSVTVAAGAATSSFTAQVSSVSSSQTATLTASAGGVTKNYSITLAGRGVSTPGVLSSLSCSHNAMSGPATDACTVSLTGAAGSGGLNVSLSSNNAAVSVPRSVTIAAGATKSSFTAQVSSVSSSQTATLTASAGGVAKSYAISLSKATAALTVQSASVAFGDISLNTPANQAVVLTSSGSLPVTISAASVSGGPGFSVTGPGFPLTIAAGQSATLYLQFDPTTSGSVTGGVTLATNTSAGNVTISLSGTGQATSYEVDLTWNAPTDSTDPVASYNIYRAVSGSSSYQLVNSAAGTNYTDSTVANGTTYIYYVDSVDADGNQSAPSNTFTISIP